MRSATMTSGTRCPRVAHPRCPDTMDGMDLGMDLLDSHALGMGLGLAAPKKASRRDILLGRTSQAALEDEQARYGLGEGIAPGEVWQCHCCAKDNVATAAYCCCCGRGAGYRRQNASRPLSLPDCVAAMRANQVEGYLDGVARTRSAPTTSWRRRSTRRPCVACARTARSPRARASTTPSNRRAGAAGSTAARAVSRSITRRGSSRTRGGSRSTGASSRATSRTSGSPPATWTPSRCTARTVDRTSATSSRTASAASGTDSTRAASRM